MKERAFARRDLLGAGLAMVTMAAASPAMALMPERRLAVHNVNTGERFDACYFSNGRFRPAGLAELNHALRDWRTGKATHMDPRLLDLLVDVRARLDVAPRRPLDIICGYRCPETNRMRHAQSAAVASNSQHVLGRASDVAIPGISTARLRDVAMTLRGGGVGYYPRDGFVHIDTGPVRHWG